MRAYQAESKPRLIPAKSSERTPVSVVISFHLWPSRADKWRSTWTRIERYALRLPACRSFTIVESSNDVARCIFTQWEDVSAFHRFVRENGLLWIERAAGYSQAPTRFTFLFGSAGLEAYRNVMGQHQVAEATFV